MYPGAPELLFRFEVVVSFVNAVAAEKDSSQTCPPNELVAISPSAGIVPAARSLKTANILTKESELYTENLASLVTSSAR